ncbi:hypothetical protein PIB30_078656 [Stylosanthes scabra]|uniref:Uncharacterized protein n=1 Tax=Stylosanthes scabra TaxID=79078 RepID=A0ABU6TS93_9FABA|nr:hypothetical protein [Stylosanthes scabra]
MKHVSLNRNEATLVEKISQSIHEILISNLPSSMNKLVGIDSRVEQVISHIGIGLNDVRYIGICGMGGIGKTTTARIVYETIQSEFEVTYFLANVRETCEKNGIVQVQKELVDLINGSSNFINDEHYGRSRIQGSLCHNKALLVLDDIDKEEQLKNLGGEKNWFGCGSRIIITTRDKHLLDIYDAHEIYNIEPLAKSEAFDLFCWKAFKQPKPAEKYLELSKQVVQYCAGLPLALDVLGSYLCNRSPGQWRSALAKLKSCPYPDIFKPLRISYDGLDSMEKEMFLDIAYFFKGFPRKYVINILKGCDYHVDIGIANSIDRSLLTIDKNDKFEMHDLLEEMGKHIVIQESPMILASAVGCGLTRTSSLFLLEKRDSNAWMFLYSDQFLEKLKRLNLDSCSGVKQIPDLSEAPNLESLTFSGTSLIEFPSYLTRHKSLVILNLNNCHSLTTLGRKLEMSSLQELNLIYCSKFRKLPEFGARMHDTFINS